MAAESLIPVRGRRQAVRLTLAAVAAAALAACDAPTSSRETPGYDPRPATVDDGGTLQRYVYHWPLGAAIRVFVDSRGGPAESDLRAAFLDGAARWAPALYYREATFRLVDDSREADVTVHFGEADSPVGSGSCAPPFSPAAGATFACPDLAARVFETLPLADGGGGRVKMDVTVYRSRVADEAQFRRVVAHEIGHVLGIGTHSGDADDLMFALPAVDAPSAADARTLRWLLHEPADVRP